MARSEATIEAEVKAHLDDPDALRSRLLDQGAHPAGSVRQMDTYFDHPTRAFGETDEALRIRKQSGATRLTYKGPKMDKETKTRTEIDVGIEEPDRHTDLLEALGFDPVATVVKDREMFTMGEITITIDDVDGLGMFAELEEVVPEEEVKGAREDLLSLADELGLDRLERRSYLEMLLEKEEEAGG